MRTLALLLAAAVTALPLAVLLYGLSVRVIEAMRQAPMPIEWIPADSPPPPAETVKPERPLERTGAGAPAPIRAAPPAEHFDAPVAAPAATAPPPVIAPVDAGGIAGQGSGQGAGDGSGGKGGGGDGGSGSGTRARISYASWIVMPGTAELMPFNPPRARKERVNGNILLSCHVLRSTHVSGCRVISEAPPGYGFGDAALAASAIFRFNPPTRDGVVMEDAWTEIPVAFYNRRSR